MGQPTHCSVQNDTSYLRKGKGTFLNKIHEAANVMSKVWQWFPGGHVSNKENHRKIEDKFINLTALPYDYEGTMNSVNKFNS